MTHARLPIPLSPLLLAACATPSLDATPRYGLMSLDGEVQTDASPGAEPNSFDQLGLDDDEDTPGASLDLKWGMPHLSISTQSTNFTGSGTVTSELEIGGDTITVGSDVDSDIDLGITSALLTWDLAPTDRVEAGLGFGLVLLDLDLHFREQSTSNTVESQETIPVPVLAGRLGLRAGPFEVVGTLSGLDVEIDDDSATFVDLDVSGKYHLAGGSDRLNAWLVLGYRATDLELEYTEDGDDVATDLEVTGPYLGLTFSF